MTIPDSTIQQLQPWINAIVVAIVGAAVTYATALLHKYTGIAIDKSNQDALEAEIRRQAGYAVAKAANNLAHTEISIKSPIVQASADFLVKNLPNVVQAAGKSPDDVAHMVAAAIGELQAKMPPALRIESAPPAVTPAAPGA